MCISLTATYKYYMNQFTEMTLDTDNELLIFKDSDNTMYYIDTNDIDVIITAPVGTYHKNLVVDPSEIVTPRDISIADAERLG